MTQLGGGGILRNAETVPPRFPRAKDKTLRNLSGNRGPGVRPRGFNRIKELRGGRTFPPVDGEMQAACFRAT